MDKLFVLYERGEDQHRIYLFRSLNGARARAAKLYGAPIPEWNGLIFEDFDREPAGFYVEIEEIEVND